MTSKLQEMHQQCLAETAASDASRTQRLVAQCCLASFVSFLTFAAAGSTGNSSNSSLGEDTGNQFQPGISLSAALLAAVRNSKTAWVVPWVTQYLRFLSHDSFSQTAQPVQQTLQQLRALHTSQILLPEHPAFGPLQLCLRCVLDTHFEHAQEIELCEVETDDSWQEAVTSMEQVASEAGRLSGDSRYMQLCCPALEHARQALQVSWLCLVYLLHRMWHIVHASHWPS